MNQDKLLAIARKVPPYQADMIRELIVLAHDVGQLEKEITALDSRRFELTLKIANLETAINQAVWPKLGEG